MNNVGQAGVAATRQVAEFAAGISCDDLPPAVRTAAKHSFLNFLGCTIGGSSHELVDKMEAALLPFAGAGPATIIGRHTRMDALNASLINCLSSAVYTFDDTHAEAIVHPSGPVAAPLLALSEMRPVTGKDFLAAFTVGVEMVCRLSKAISVAPAQGSIAWSQTGVTGGIGGAIAAGRLLGLDITQLQYAIGLAVTQASGIRVVQGTMSSSLMPANAGQVALRAATLAQAGVISSETAIEGRYGFLDVYAPTPHAAYVTDGLGVHYEILSNTFKPYPSGIVVNPVIEACLRLRELHAFDIKQIERVEVRVNPKALALTNRPSPKTGLEAQVSLQHWASVALIHGVASIRQTFMETVDAPDSVWLRSKVTAVADPGHEVDGAEVVIELRDKTSQIYRVEHCIGSASRPMTEKDLELKFRGLVEGKLSAHLADSLIEKCWNLEDVSDVAVICREAAAGGA